MFHTDLHTVELFCTINDSGEIPVHVYICNAPLIISATRSLVSGPFVDSGHVGQINL
jgi:hypothetical protein